MFLHVKTKRGKYACTSLTNASDARIMFTNQSKRDQIAHEENSDINGRPEKEAVVCYCFWIGASLAILGVREFIDSIKFI